MNRGWVLDHQEIRPLVDCDLAFRPVDTPAIEDLTCGALAGHVVSSGPHSAGSNNVHNEFNNKSNLERILMQVPIFPRGGNLIRLIPWCFQPIPGSLGLQ